MRFPLVLRGCRNDGRCNFRFVLLTDRTRLVVRLEPLRAKRLSVFRFVAIKYAILFKYLFLINIRFRLADSVVFQKELKSMI